MDKGRAHHISCTALALALEAIDQMEPWQRPLSDQSDMKKMFAKIASVSEREVYRATAHAKLTGDGRTAKN